MVPRARKPWVSKYERAPSQESPSPILASSDPMNSR